MKITQNNKIIRGRKTAKATFEVRMQQEDKKTFCAWTLNDMFNTDSLFKELLNDLIVKMA